METEIIETKERGLQAEVPFDIVGELKTKLAEAGVGTDKIAEVINGLLSATTLNNKGDVMADNKARIAAVELVLKLHGVKGLGKGAQIAIFNNIPNKDERLKY